MSAPRTVVRAAIGALLAIALSACEVAPVRTAPPEQTPPATPAVDAAPEEPAPPARPRKPERPKKPKKPTVDAPAVAHALGAPADAVAGRLEALAERRP